jgi:hypothetical protein
MTNLLLKVNVSSVDAAYDDSGMAGSYVTVEAADSLIFSAGLTGVVEDGLPIPNPLQPALNRAATLLDPGNVTIVQKYFIADSSAGYLYEIFNAGNKDKQFVFCCSFDDATTSEPQLEAWDDINLATYLLLCLGNGDPASSWYRAKCTTLASSGPNWIGTGTPLAGSGTSNVVKLNASGGVLTGAKDLYFNFGVRIPGTASTPNIYLPVLVVTYTSN